jgi:hypothetical protein
MTKLSVKNEKSLEDLKSLYESIKTCILVMNNSSKLSEEKEVEFRRESIIGMLIMVRNDIAHSIDIRTSKLIVGE